MPLYKAFQWVQHIQNLMFSHQNSIKNSCFFWCIIQDLIFWDFNATWCQKAWFWEPLGPQLGTKWRLKSPKWRSNGTHFSKTVAPFYWHNQRRRPNVTQNGLLEWARDLTDAANDKIYKWNQNVIKYKNDITMKSVLIVIRNTAIKLWFSS